MSKIVLNDELLKNAVSIYQDRYFAKTEFNENKFETSRSFDIKIKKMIKSENNWYHRVTLTTARKVICVFVAVLMLIVSSLGVDATKNILGGFYITPGVGNDQLHEFIEEGVSYPQEIEKYYEIPNLPDEYKLVRENITNGWGSYRYESNTDLTFIDFEQDLKGTLSMKIDNMHTTLSEEDYKGQEYFVAKSDFGNYTVLWDNGEYIFYLYSNLPKEEILELCASVKEK